MIQMNRWVKVATLAKYQNPFRQTTWAGLTRPVDRRRVEFCYANDKFIRRWECRPKTEDEHAQRIAHFVKRGWRSAICATILPARDGGHTQQPVWDGLHRLAAAIYKKQTWILVNITGDLELAEEVLQPYAHSDNGTDVVGEVRGSDRASGKA
jgi:hypothetical protein